MFNQFREKQFKIYTEAYNYYEANPAKLIDVEKFVLNEICHFIDLHLPEIKRDYDEASYLYPFWQNYPPEDRGLLQRETNIHGLK